MYLTLSILPTTLRVGLLDSSVDCLRSMLLTRDDGNDDHDDEQAVGRFRREMRHAVKETMYKNKTAGDTLTGPKGAPSQF